MPGDEIGMMLHRGDENLVARFDVRITPTAGHQVDAGGAARSEDDFACVPRANESSDFLARFLVLLGTAFAKRVDAAVDVGIIALVNSAKHLDDLPRPLRAGCVVQEDERAVAVDHLLEDWKVRPQSCRQELRRIKHDAPLPTCWRFDRTHSITPSQTIVSTTEIRRTQRRK